MTGTGKNRILRVSIDRKDRSISIQDCEKVSTALNLLLDANDVIPGGAYFLEVSSPGIERNLSQDWQYEYVIGQHLDVRTSDKIEVEKGDPYRFQGTLEAIEDGNLKINTGSDETVQIPIALIQKAKTVFKAPGSPKPKAGKPKQKKLRGKKNGR